MRQQLLGVAGLLDSTIAAASMHARQSYKRLAGFVFNMLLCSCMR
jgi:hypothetical protein